MRIRSSSIKYKVRIGGYRNNMEIHFTTVKKEVIRKKHNTQTRKLQ